ncbi:MAG: di-trans,poly-cis-decaprenylcistransferase [Magnetococcales bacterium]|nr:di-trans,poly-cis-decaprenylcistransferase [Magnetococcales bacterium]
MTRSVQRIPNVPPESMPRHVAIIMDGNRRWAKRRHLPSLEGHRRGVKSVRRTISACLDLGIETLTVYTFSSENWQRAAEEVSALMNLLSFHLRKEMEDFVEKEVRFRALGRLDGLPDKILEGIDLLESTTKDFRRLNFNIAVNYGGRLELVDAARELAHKVAQGTLNPDDIDETLFADQLTTVGQADPDLLIRTGGDHRISNFLLWQLAYTELVFMNLYWPEFEKIHMIQAIEEFSRRERRFGATK